MNAKELQGALEARLNSGVRLGVDDVLIWNAARQIALPILEADPELVKRVRLALLRYHRITTSNIHAATDDVLAAISTPTPGAE